MKISGLGEDRHFGLFHFPRRRWEPAWAGHFGAWIFGPRGGLTQSGQEKASTYKQGILVIVPAALGLTVPLNRRGPLLSCPWCIPCGRLCWCQDSLLSVKALTWPTLLSFHSAVGGSPVFPGPASARPLSVCCLAPAARPWRHPSLHLHVTSVRTCPPAQAVPGPCLSDSHLARGAALCPWECLWSLLGPCFASAQQSGQKCHGPPGWGI